MTKNTQDLIELLTKIYAKNNQRAKVHIWTREGDYVITFYGKQMDIEPIWYLYFKRSPIFSTSV
jgi:hypothetical protein